MFEPIRDKVEPLKADGTLWAIAITAIGSILAAWLPVLVKLV